MEKGLQDTIAAIHGTIIADMENFVSTTPICLGTGTFFNKSALITG
jgi:hypothetical protein